MSEALISWFMTNLGGKVGKEAIIFIISMVPILELRGGLLAASERADVDCNSGVYHRKPDPDSVYSVADHTDL